MGAGIAVFLRQNDNYRYDIDLDQYCYCFQTMSLVDITLE